RPGVAGRADFHLAPSLAGPPVRVITGDWYRSTAHLSRTFGFGRSELLFSRGAADWLEQHAPEARVFNDDGLGGWLLWRSLPPRRGLPPRRPPGHPPPPFPGRISRLPPPP